MNQNQNKQLNKYITQNVSNSNNKNPKVQPIVQMPTNSSNANQFNFNK